MRTNKIGLTERRVALPWCFVVLAGSAAVVALGGGCAPDTERETDSANAMSLASGLLVDPLRTSLRMNQVQVIGSHNSYKEAIAPRLLAAYAAENAESAASLDYWHPPLSEQLDLGLRKLEIDVVHDPDGGRYASPNGLALAPEEGVLAPALFDLSGSLAEPGFKALHVQDLDFRSNCPTFVGCLLELRSLVRNAPRPYPGAGHHEHQGSDHRSRGLC